MRRGIAFFILMAAGLPAPAILAQSDPAFEAATIKPSIPDEPGSGVVVAGRRFHSTNTTVVDLLAFAYTLHPRQITGGPAWLGSDKFDLLGEIGGAGNPDPDSIREMVRQLLADRFQLTFHRSSKELSVYEIVVGKAGPRFTGKPGNPNLNPGFGFRGLGAMTVRSASVADFAGWMQRYVLDRPVIDHTGISGKYDFSLDWTPDESQFRDRSGMSTSSNARAEPPDLYTAIRQQLGLKLESAKAPVEVLVIDRVEKPSDN